MWSTGSSLLWGHSCCGGTLVPTSRVYSLDVVDGLLIAVASLTQFTDSREPASVVATGRFSSCSFQA